MLQGCLNTAQPAAESTSILVIKSPTPILDTPIQATSAFIDIPTATPFPPTPTTLVSTLDHLTATPTVTECMQVGGYVEVSEFSTVLLPDPLVYRVYLPPCYDEHSEQAYPVLYLIHGQTYSDKQWEDLGVPEVLDRLIASGQVVPFIVVMPQDRVWREPTRDNFGKAVAQSLIPWIDDRYRTLSEREFRAIGGLSRGGAWALDIGLSNPDLFSAIGMHSGFVFYTDVQLVHGWLDDLQSGMTPRIYMDIADKDRPEITDSATWLEGLLTEYGVSHEWHMFIGEHEEAYWKAHVEDYLRWYSQNWGK